MKKFVMITIILLSLAACRQSVDLEAPPEILYGEDVCTECSMIINEARFAASYVTTSGDVRRFDDIGGMLVHDQKMQEAVHIYWVHDLNTEEWINANSATFVLSRNLNTPMGWGVAAFADSADAAAYVAANEGVSTTYAALQEEIKTGALDPTAFADHEHEMENGEMDQDGMEPEDGEMEMDHDDMNHDDSSWVIY